MKKYNPTRNIWSTVVDGQIGPPDFIGQREEIMCPLCNRRIMIAVREEFIDWESVAMEYKDRLSKVMLKYAQVAADTEALYGENPAAKHFHNEIAVMLDQINKDFNGP